MSHHLPDFIVLGATRGGTAVLHYTLGQHLGIYLSAIKETNFFALGASDGLDGATLGFPLPDDEKWARSKPMAATTVESCSAWRI